MSIRAEVRGHGLDWHLIQTLVSAWSATVAEHRNATALSGFLIEQGPRWCGGVHVVVSDGRSPTRPRSMPILAEPVTSWTGSMSCTGSPRAFLLVRRDDTLDPNDQTRLNELFTKYPRLDLAWQALQELHGLYLADDRDGALDAMDRFTDLYATGQLVEFHDVV